MSKLNIAAQNVARLLSAKSPTILAGVAIAGVVSTAILAVKATPQALHILQDETNKRELAYQEDGTEVEVITPFEVVKLTGLGYVPAAVLGAVTIACIVGSNSIHTRRQAALLGLYSITEKAFNEYQEKVVEVVGEKKDDEVRASLAEDRLKARPDVLEEDAEFELGQGGVTRCYDSFSGRYFYSDMETIRAAENTINKEIIDNFSASLNDFYLEIGLDPTKGGEMVGWNLDRMLNLSFAPLLTPNGHPCLAIDYKAYPTVDFHRHG